MSPDQALETLDQIAALAPVNRMTHQQALNALQVIRQALAPASSPEVVPTGHLPKHKARAPKK